MFNFFGPKVKTIDSPELKSRISSGENILIIDVCEEYEYKSNHIKGALNMPLGRLADMFSKKFDDLSNDSEIIVYCAHGIRSKHAAKQLMGLGFENVRSLNNGIASYLSH